MLRSRTLEWRFESLPFTQLYNPTIRNVNVCSFIQITFTVYHSIAASIVLLSNISSADHLAIVTYPPPPTHFHSSAASAGVDDGM